MHLSKKDCARHQTVISDHSYYRAPQEPCALDCWVFGSRLERRDVYMASDAMYRTFSVQLRYFHKCFGLSALLLVVIPPPSIEIIGHIGGVIKRINCFEDVDRVRTTPDFSNGGLSVPSQSHPNSYIDRRLSFLRNIRRRHLSLPKCKYIQTGASVPQDMNHCTVWRTHLYYVVYAILTYFWHSKVTISAPRRAGDDSFFLLLPSYHRCSCIAPDAEAIAIYFHPALDRQVGSGIDMPLECQ